MPTESQDELDNVSKLNAILKSKIEEAYLDYIRDQGRGMVEGEAKKSDSTGACGKGQADKTQGVGETVKFIHHFRKGTKQREAQGNMM